MYFRMGFMGFSVVVALVLLTAAAFAEPVIANVSVEQRTDGSGLVAIFYDLSNGLGSITIEVVLTNDGGATWQIIPKPQYLTDDVGVVTNGYIPTPCTISLSLNAPTLLAVTIPGLR